MNRKRMFHFTWCLAQMVLLFLVIAKASEKEFNCALIMIMISFVGNLWVSFINRKQQIIILLFNLTMFLFLLGRPFVSFLRGECWWEVASASAVAKSLIAIEVVLALLPLGAFLSKKGSFDKRRARIEAHMKSMEKLRSIALIVLIFGLFGSAFDGLQKIAFMTTHTYTDYYVSYRSTLPYLLKAFVRMMQPALCLYLATFPKKKPTFIILSLYILTTVPSMIVGMRSPTMLSLLFCFTYFCMREYLYPNKEIWIGKIERLILVVAVPILIVFLYIYNFIRNGIAYTINQNILFDFLYQQGNSFSYLAQGFDVLHILPMNEFPGYMLGPSYDNVVYGSIIGRMIFGTSAIVGQSMDAVTRGHNMASHLSYILLGKEYLSGYGTGTVFILEIVHDVGWGGLVLYAIVFGWLCVKIMNSFASAKIVTNVIFLYSLLEIYFVPRSSALYFLMRSFITPYFWITLLFVIAVSKLYFHFKIKVMPIKIKLVG